ncbi:hypothetical protein BJX63DRAFT_361502 [Aspergillus granulosus]|uniref:Secreted protein n=1 Tax=Aspergillus granulosus TaxID=176169 RepID=A0ABR4HWA6_9EURO
MAPFPLGILLRLSSLLYGAAWPRCKPLTGEISASLDQTSLTHGTASNTTGRRVSLRHLCPLILLARCSLIPGFSQSTQATGITSLKNVLIPLQNPWHTVAQRFSVQAK